MIFGFLIGVEGIAMRLLKILGVPRPSDMPLVKLAVNGQSETVTPGDDLYFQAATRGGRVVGR
jgi:hypothetical protein